MRAQADLLVRRLRKALAMRVILQDGRLIVAAEDDAERELFAVWRVGRKGHVFFFDGGSAKGGAMHDLGPQEEACREPINIVFDQVEARWQPISNLASTPFRLGGRTYASRFYAAGMTVIETCRKRGVDPWAYARDLIATARKGQPAPCMP